MAGYRSPEGALRAVPYLLCALLAYVPGRAAADGAGHAGSETCLTCHTAQAEEFAGTVMGKVLMKNPRNETERLGCESCHGQGADHVEALQSGGDPLGKLLSFRADAGESVTEQNAACLECHERGDQAYWRGSAHESRGLACTSCHTVMKRSDERGQLAKSDSHTSLACRRAATEVCLDCHPNQRAQLQRSSHMPLREGKLTCASCHNPHGGAVEALLKDNSVNENCCRCHTEKRGPFL